MYTYICRYKYYWALGAGSIKEGRRGGRRSTQDGGQYQRIFQYVELFLSCFLAFWPVTLR